MSWNVSLPANSSLMKLSAGYIRSNNSGIQTVISSSSLSGGYPLFPTTAPIYMYTDSGAIPSGWTLYSSVSDCLLAIQGGSSQYNTTGGTGTAIGTWNGPPYALIASQLPNLAADATVRTGSSGLTNFMGSTSGGSSAVITLNVNTGGGATHQHNWTTTRPLAAVGNLVTKNT